MHAIKVKTKKQYVTGEGVWYKAVLWNKALRETPLI